MRADTGNSWAWWAACAGAAVVGGAALCPLWTSDLFGHLAAGRQIVALGRVPDHDTFSFYFDAPQPWRNHNWAAGLLFWMLHSLGGADALVVAKVVLLAILGAVLVRTADRSTWAPWICVLILLWAIPDVRIRFSMRPHILGLLACGLLLAGLVRLAREGAGKRGWPVIGMLGALQVVWVNTHGSGPLAFLCTGAFIVGHFGDRSLQRTYAILMLTLAIASCVSPWGPSILLETFKHIGSEGTRHFIGEWMPLASSHDPWDWASCIAAGLLLSWVAVPMWRAGHLTRSEWIVAVGMLLMAIRSVRFVGHALLLAAPFLAHGVGLRLRSWAVSQQRLRQGALSLGALALAGVVVVPWVAAARPPYQDVGLGVSARNLPTAQGRWLARHRPRARIIGLMEDAWYLSFAVPDSKVLVDGRQAIYPLDVLQRAGAALKDPRDLFALVEQKRGDAIVLRHNRPTHAASIAALVRDPRFGVASIGDRHVLFVRDLPSAQTIRVVWPNLALRTFSGAQRARARHELSTIDAVPGAAAYVGFQRALLRLSQDLRGGGADGLSPSRDEATRQRYGTALADLAPGLHVHENLPTVQLLAALLRARLCQVDAAERSLRIAREEGDNRHTVAIGIELAIARGQTQQARQMLSDLEQSARGDGWLQAMGRELEAGSPCR